MLSYDKKKSLDYLKGIFETAREGIFFVDPNGQISITNPAFIKLLGYKKRELEGKLFIEIIHRKARVKKVTSTNKLHHFRRSSKLPFEMELINKKGTAIPVKLRSTLIKDAKGKTVEAIGIVEDLRKNKGEQAFEQKVWETQETLHNILANSGDSIFVADGNGRITLVNEALLQMLGYKEDELVGQHLTELSPYKGRFTTTTGEKIVLDEEYINYQVAKANELFEKGKVINYELYWIHKDGKIIPVEATLSLLNDQQGERRGSIAICRNITERKNLEKDLKIHLKNLELRNKERLILLDTTQKLYAAENLEETLTIAIDGIQPLFATLGNIALLSDDKKFTQIVRVYMDSKLLAKVESLTSLQFTGLKILLENGNVYTQQYKENLPIVANVSLTNSEKVIRTDLKTMAKDLFKKKSAQRKLALGLVKLSGYQSSISVPFVSERGKSFGNIAIADHRIMTADEYYLLKIYASIISNAIERKQAEDELKKARDFLENIFKTSADGIIITAKGVITMVNQAVERMLGYSKSELIGKRTYELAPKGKYYEEKGTALVKKLFKEGIIVGEEQTWLKKDGNLVHIELNLALLKDKDGINHGGIVSIRDITLRKEAEERLRMLERAVEQSMDGIAVADMEGMLQFVNIFWAKMHGYNSVSELLSKHLSIFHTEEQLQKEVIPFNDQVKKVGSNQGEVNHVHKNGNVFSTWMGATLLKSEEGKPLGFVATARDITERKKAEEALKQTEEEYHSLIETANDAIISTNHEGTITSFNKKAEEMYGYSRGEILGKSILILFPPSKVARQKKGLRRFKKEKIFSPIETPTETINVRKNGQEFPVEASVSSLEVHGERIFTSFIRDITERKNMEHILFQSEKLRSLGELAGGVAHDFNNVLAAILGRVQLLRMQIGPPPKKEERRKTTRDLRKSLEIIEKAALDGTETIRRIQEFSRKRDDDKYFADVDINKVVDDALEFTKVRWKDEAETKGITIHIKETLAHLAHIAGSAPELREVITNLINNAIDAMPQGGEIRLGTLMNNSHVVIKISDTGSGIPHTLADRIFDPFFTTKGPQSTGLGMSVSYGIINRHQGTINFNSVEGEGTTFTIQLPSSEQIPEKREITEFKSKKQRKVKILVIEDEQDVLELLKDILTDNGHEVETTTNGRQGIKLFREHHFDLVFTDLGMPEMSGWQVAEEVKKINKKTPVALITGWEVQLKKNELRKSGVDLFVNKPFQVDEVRRLVEEGIDLQIKGKKATKLTRDGKKKKTRARKNRNPGRK